MILSVVAKNVKPECLFSVVHSIDLLDTWTMVAPCHVVTSAPSRLSFILQPFSQASLLAPRFVQEQNKILNTVTGISLDWFSFGNRANLSRLIPVTVYSMMIEENTHNVYYMCVYVNTIFPYSSGRFPQGIQPCHKVGRVALILLLGDISVYEVQIGI